MGFGQAALFLYLIGVMIEIWKEVKGWDGKYLISDHGRFKSINGKYRVSRPEGYITLGCIGFAGYREVSLRKPGIVKKVRVHTLVAEHFIYKPSSSECVNHKDGNKENNHWSNLEWLTRRDNCKHALETGLFNNKGEKHHHAKLTEIDVIRMRKLRLESKLSYEELGRRFGICRRQASDVVTGKNWGWIKASEHA